MRTVEKVRITKVPQGDAPLAVREKWVGLVLPCLGSSANVVELGLFNREIYLPSREVLLVPQEEAIAELSKSSPEAAAWWRDHGFPRPEGMFSFGADEGEVIGAN